MLAYSPKKCPTMLSLVCLVHSRSHIFLLTGQVLDCSLAKPPAADKKDDRVPLPSSNGAPLLPSYPPLGYGIMSVPGAYGAAPASTAQVHEYIIIIDPFVQSMRKYM
jgi:hypothetical protein